MIIMFKLHHSHLKWWKYWKFDISVQLFQLFYKDEEKPLFLLLVMHRGGNYLK